MINTQSGGERAPAEVRLPRVVVLPERSQQHDGPVQAGTQYLNPEYFKTNKIVDRKLQLISLGWTSSKTRWWNCWDAPCLG